MEAVGRVGHVCGSQESDGPLAPASVEHSGKAFGGGEVGAALRAVKP